MAGHERRFKRLKGLRDEARRVVVELAVQIAATEKAARDLDAQAVKGAQPEPIQEKLRACREDLAALHTQHDEQQAQAGRLEMELAKAKATVLGLRSQRDVLKARMKAVEAQRRGEGTSPSRRTWFGSKRKRLLAVAGIAVLVLGAFSLWLAGKSPMLPQGVTPAPGVTKDLEALFDGKTLDGWRIEGDAQWTVSDGAIQGGGEGTGVLVSQRAFADFELEADVKINSAGNSGLFFRIVPGANTSPARWDATTTKWYEVQVIGSERQFGGGYPHTGDLFGFAKVSADSVHDDQWFHLGLRASGNHMVVKIDGKTVVDYVDERNSFASGSIGLQKYGPLTRVSYRNIRVKTLPDGRAAPLRKNAIELTLTPAGPVRQNPLLPRIAFGEWTPLLPPPDLLLGWDELNQRVRYSNRTRDPRETEWFPLLASPNQLVGWEKSVRLCQLFQSNPGNASGSHFLPDHRQERQGQRASQKGVGQSNSVVFRLGRRLVRRLFQRRAFL